MQTSSSHVPFKYKSFPFEDRINSDLVSIFIAWDFGTSYVPILQPSKQVLLWASSYGRNETVKKIRGLLRFESKTGLCWWG